MDNEELEIVRARTRKIASAFLERGDSVGWFDALYTD